MSNTKTSGPGKREVNTPPFRGGAPTLQETTRFGEEIESAKKSPYMIINPTFITDSPSEVINYRETKAANAGKYPIRPLPRDKYDTIWAIKEDMTKEVRDSAGHIVAPAMVNPKRPLPYTEEDIAYLKRKRDAEENAGFLFWQANKYDLNDPATREWFNKVCPSYFTQRESLIEEQIDLAARYSKIRLRGARTEDDLKLQYFIETDRVSLPKGPLWDPYEWMKMEAGIPNSATVAETRDQFINYNSEQYRKGLFNPTRVMTPQKGALVPNRYNPGDIAGTPNTNYTGVYGAAVSGNEYYNTAYSGTRLNPTLGGARYELIASDNAYRLNNLRNMVRQENAMLVATGRGLSPAYTENLAPYTPVV